MILSNTPSVPQNDPLRVMMISHAFYLRAHGQMRAGALAAYDDLSLLVVAPDRWKDDYGNWRSPEIPADDRYEFHVEKIRWPHVGPFKRYLHWYPRLGQVIERFKPDIIDIWEEPWGLVSAQICRLRNRLISSAKIISETEQNINKKLPLPFERFRSYSLKNANYVIARNTQAIEVTRAKGYRGEARVIGNAVDAELFHPMDRLAAKAALGLDGFVVGYVGRLVEEKGLMDLLDAVPSLSPDVRVAYVGNGPMLEPLQKRAAELGIAGRVIFIPGRPLQDLPQVMNALDALILPSRTTPAWKEQFGRVIIEAQACGTPVIGSDSGAIPDVVCDGGLIVPERNPGALAAAITQFQHDPPMCRHMGEAGRKLVLEKYTWSRIAAQMHDLYLELARSSGANPVNQPSFSSQESALTAPTNAAR